MAAHVFLERPQEPSSNTRHRRRPSAAEVAGAAASDTYPVFDLYLLARLSVQEAVDGESLDDQVSQGKRDAAAVLGIEEDRITFVDADPDVIGELTGPLVRVSATYISGGAPWEQRGDLREIIELARAGRVQAVITPNLDRVARNVEVAHRFRRELVSAGVRTLFEGCVPYDLVDDNQQLTTPSVPDECGRASSCGQGPVGAETGGRRTLSRLRHDRSLQLVAPCPRSRSPAALIRAGSPSVSRWSAGAGVEDTVLRTRRRSSWRCPRSGGGG